MLNNCSGGNTPWGTVLTAEENFNQYFGNVGALQDGPLKTAYLRYGVNFDFRGNMWIGTDGMEAAIRFYDMLYTCPTEGPNRGKLQPFMSMPNAAECCGPEFTPDGTTLFFAVQHPGEGGVPGGNALSSWPFGSQPPRPAVIAI